MRLSFRKGKIMNGFHRITSRAACLCALAGLPMVGCASGEAKTPAPTVAAADAAPAMPAPGMGGGYGYGAGMRNLPPEQRVEMIEQRREERLQALKTRLQLTPDQEGAWQKFVADMPAMIPAPLPPETVQQLTAVQHMEYRLANRQRMLDQEQQRLQAMKTFYGKLTPAQQKVFDADPMFAMPGPGGRGGPGMGGGRGFNGAPRMGPGRRGAGPMM